MDGVDCVDCGLRGRGRVSATVEFHCLNTTCDAPNTRPIAGPVTGDSESLFVTEKFSIDSVALPGLLLNCFEIKPKVFYRKNKLACNTQRSFTD